MIKQIMVSIILIFFLTGCFCDKKVILKDKLIYNKIPKTIINDDIVLTKPPDKNLYIKASPVERELMLRNVIIGLYKNISEYKIKLIKIKEYDDNISKKINMINIE